MKSTEYIVSLLEREIGGEVDYFKNDGRLVYHVITESVAIETLAEAKSRVYQETDGLVKDDSVKGTIDGGVCVTFRETRPRSRQSLTDQQCLEQFEQIE